MHYMLMPLDQHFDDGLGATGEAFEEAAKLLTQNADQISSSHPHLPANFLYRHAIELYLKSMIIVLHRALKVPYGSEPHDGIAFVPRNGKWAPIHAVHSVATLWTHFLELTRAQEAALKARCKTDWQKIPDGLHDAILAIENADSSSTFFRYPDKRNPDKDKQKSSWKAREPEDIIESMKTGGKPIKAFLILRSDDTVEQAFQYDDDPLAELTKLLEETASTLSGAHIGLRVELAGGR